MIFVVEMEEMTLYSFSSEADAVSYCEGVDVEDGVWLFWDNKGQPLEPKFSAQNMRGAFVVRSGKYTLEVSTEKKHDLFESLLGEIRSFEGEAPFDSVDGVRSYLEKQRRGRLCT